MECLKVSEGQKMNKEGTALEGHQCWGVFIIYVYFIFYIGKLSSYSLFIVLKRTF